MRHCKIGEVMIKTTTKTILRPFSFDDAQACVDLFNACSQKLFGWDDAALDKLMNEWTSPGINVEETIRVVENRQGDIIGYIDVWDNTKPHVIKYIWGVLHPDAWDEVLYHQMLTWAEKTALSRVPLAPEGARVIMQQGASKKDIPRKAALEAFGFELVRHFYRMQIDLKDQPLQPTVPDGITIVPIQMETELQDAVLAMHEAFKDHWGHVDTPADELISQWDHFIENDKDFDPTLWFLAKDGEQIAGTCRCSNKLAEDPDMGWVNQLCVGKPWRRRGLGMALLLTAFAEFYQRGKQRVGLGVDASSLTNATRLYEKAGMRVSQQYDTFVKVLRPGKDWTTTG